MDLVVEEKEKQSEPWKQMQLWLRITFFNLCYVCRTSHRGEYYAYKCLKYYGSVWIEYIVAENWKLKTENIITK